MRQITIRAQGQARTAVYRTSDSERHTTDRPSVTGQETAEQHKNGIDTKTKYLQVSA
jgi:hypothetical protein